jgi:ribonuclease HI
VLDERALHIYTDGSSYSNPRRGGVGVLYVVFSSLDEELVTELSFPGYKEGTNNQMELYACILGLRNAGKNFDLTKYRRKIVSVRRPHSCRTLTLERQRT